MNTVLYIRSSAFPSHGTGDEGVNYDTGDGTGIFGKRLALFLADRLEQRGWRIADCLAEDWGWMVELKHDRPFPLFVGCSNVEDDMDLPDGETCFRIFTEPDRPHFRRWFRKVDASAELTRLTGDLRHIIDTAPDITLIGEEQPEG